MYNVQCTMYRQNPAIYNEQCTNVQCTMYRLHRGTGYNVQADPRSSQSPTFTPRSAPRPSFTQFSSNPLSRKLDKKYCKSEKVSLSFSKKLSGPSSAQTPLSRKFKKENIAKVRNFLDLTIFYSLFGLGNSYGHGNSHLCHDLGHGLVLVPGDIVLTNTLYFAHFSQRE